MCPVPVFCFLPPAMYQWFFAAVVPEGGACLFGRLQTLPLALFPAPIPPTPFPAGRGGESRLFHARGFAPCIPATEPARHWEMGANQAPGGGVPSLPPANPTFSFVSCPYPPCPPSRREGGRFLVYFAGGSAPGTPALNRLRHLQNLPSGCPERGFAPCETGGGWRSDTRRERGS